MLGVRVRGLAFYRVTRVKFDALLYFFVQLNTPQNNLRTNQCKFPLMVYLVRSVAQTRHDIEKRFSVPLKGVKHKAFPIKNIAFKFFAFSASQICNFPQIFKKSCFIILGDV